MTLPLDIRMLLRNGLTGIFLTFPKLLDPSQTESLGGHVAPAAENGVQGSPTGQMDMVVLIA